MKRLAVGLIVMASTSLTACSHYDGWNWGSSKARTKSTAHSMTTTNNPSDPSATNPPVSNPAAQSQVGGRSAHAMDSIDRSKLWHALDKPIGKSTSWSNASTHMNYTVVPTQKVTINGNNFCRKYQVTATVQGGSSNVTEGSACVGSDGNWEAVSG